LFDETRAAEYRPRGGFVKTAILLQLADDEAEVTVQTPFGLQTAKGAFYVVAEEGSSYCAARAEFEATHDELSPNQWVKRAVVRAYVADEHCRIETWLADGTHEASVDAGPGDWIVRQLTGEVMVVGDDEFIERYEPAS
jgi:hypothetical protein